MVGRPIQISTRPSLLAYRGRLVRSGGRGSAVYAAAFIRKRSIVLEWELLAQGDVFRLIVLHELFHFAWPRLANCDRLGFEQLLQSEAEKHARGELGESSSVNKSKLYQIGCRGSERAWHDYVCESFCDTAAWVYGGVDDHAWFTLRKRWRERRLYWFETRAGRGPWKC